MVQAGGWLMLPILLCSVIALAIVGERFWSLQQKRINPASLVSQIWEWYKADELTDENIEALANSSPLGRVLAAGLVNRHHPREIMKESIEDTGRQVVVQLERYLNTLGTIASITPLLGLLGTVIGMIKVFAAITTHGVGNPSVLAGGISVALITTAAGLSVAIPSLIFYRYFRGKVDELVIKMEEEALKIVDVMHGDRETGQV
ncbi:MAG: MotA/TolQ/ExbB proton channel family protein [Thiohalomonadales bacterium]|nr:MotA/TolQ/ExbB proton channel family protein [Thiohalomonadales bacterium]